MSCAHTRDELIKSRGCIICQGARLSEQDIEIKRMRKALGVLEKLLVLPSWKSETNYTHIISEARDVVDRALVKS